MQQVSQTLSCMMQWSFNLKWEFCQIFILVVSLVNCCRLQHLQHVFYPRITGINHDLMLRLNSYRQAIYSWLACSILCKNTVWLCVSQFIGISLCLLTTPIRSGLHCCFYIYLNACHSHTHTLIHLWGTGRGKQSCTWQMKPAFKHLLCWFCFNMKFFTAQMQVKYKVMCSYYLIKMKNDVDFTILMRLLVLLNNNCFSLSMERKKVVTEWNAGEQPWEFTIREYQ